tara:strand:+ start:1715 stop:2653 length:939 start_codon:yes stop_codon:yes gene_type:complete
VEVLRHLLETMAQAEPRKFWMMAVILAGAAIGIFAYGFVRLQRARLLEDTPTSRIRSAAQGYVELHGHARLLPGPEIIAPLSGEKCCWWDYRVERRRTSYSGGRRRTKWVVVESGTSNDLFLLDDGTGQCVVDPVGAKIIPSVRRRWRGYHRRPKSVPKKNSFFSLGDYRYTEGIVRYGAWLYTLGQFQTQIAFRADNESLDVSELLSIWKKDKRDLLHRFDSNRDGEIDLQEWEVARREAIRIVRAEQVGRSVQPDLNILNRPAGRRPYILSTKTEHELTKGLRWSGLAMVIGGLVLALCVVFMLTVRGLF